MSCDKSVLPPVQMVGVCGFKRTLSVKELNNFRHRAEISLLAFGLPRISNHFNGRWGKVDRFLVVKESQQILLSSNYLNLNDYELIVCPDYITEYISNLREWIRTEIPFNGAKFRINFATDFMGMLDTDYQKTPIYDPDEISLCLGSAILTAQHYKVDFAGFWDRHRQPSSVAGCNGDHPQWAPILRYPKENLFLESSICQGGYPKNWNWLENAYRMLLTHENGGKVGHLGFATFEFKQSNRDSGLEKKEWTELVNKFRKGNPDDLAKNLGFKKYRNY
jgi:hypothetical protein